MLQRVPPTPTRVVVVDDHAAFRIALRAGLSAEGVEVIGEAVDGQDALGLLRTLEDGDRLPQALITDYEMTDMNGLTLVRTVTAFWPTVRVLFMTGHEQPVLLDAGLHAGAHAAFVKSPDLPRLLAEALADPAA